MHGGHCYTRNPRRQHGVPVKPRSTLAVRVRTRKKKTKMKKRVPKKATRGRQIRQLEGHEVVEDAGEEEAGGGAVRDEEVDIRSRL